MLKDMGRSVTDNVIVFNLFHIVDDLGEFCGG